MTDVKNSGNHQYVSASFKCALCENTISVIFVPPEKPNPHLIPEGPDVTQGMSKLMVESASLSVKGGPVTREKGIASENVESIKNAVLAGDAAKLYSIDYGEYAPFWCPKCGCCYCEDHYAVRFKMDTIYLDWIDTLCPKGHKRMIDS